LQVSQFVDDYEQVLHIDAHTTHYELPNFNQYLLPELESFKPNLHVVQPFPEVQEEH
jgi:hypothetical protein